METGKSTTVDDCLEYVLKEANSKRKRQILKENVILCSIKESAVDEIYPGNSRIDNIDTGSRYNPTKIVVLEKRKDAKGENQKDIELNFSKLQTNKRGNKTTLS